MERARTIRRPEASLLRCQWDSHTSTAKANVGSKARCKQVGRTPGPSTPGPQEGKTLSRLAEGHYPKEDEEEKQEAENRYLPLKASKRISRSRLFTARLLLGVASNISQTGMDGIFWGGGGTPNMENEIYELHAERYALSTAIKNQLKPGGCVSWHLSCNT